MIATRMTMWIGSIVGAVVTAWVAWPSPNPRVPRCITPVTASSEWVAPAVELPACWIPIADRDDEPSYGYDDHPYVVTIDAGALRVHQAKHRDTDTGPAVMRFAGLERGTQHTLNVEGGYLAGFEHGEWGGALLWVAPSGDASLLGQWNVVALVRRGPREVLALEEADGCFPSGRARWLEYVSGTWRTTRTVSLDDVPEAFVTTTAGVYVVTYSSLSRIDADRSVTIVQPLKADAHSMVADRFGRLWIGSTGAVLRLTPHGARFDETWFVDSISSDTERRRSPRS
jgi:hypothetical protein